MPTLQPGSLLSDCHIDGCVLYRQRVIPHYGFCCLNILEERLDIIIRSALWVEMKLLTRTLWSF